MAVSSFSFIPFLIMLFTLGAGGLPVNVPPLPEDPALVRAAPAETLVFAEWFGVGKAQATSDNLTEQLFANAENRHLFKMMESAFLRIASKEARGQLNVPEVYGLVKSLICRPGCFFLSDLKMTDKKPLPSAAVVINLGPSAKGLKVTLNNYISLLTDLLINNGPAGMEIGSLTIGEETFNVLPIPGAGVPLNLTWGYHNEYFLLGIGEGTIAGAIKGLAGAAGLTANEEYKQLMKQAAVARPATRIWWNTKAITRVVSTITRSDTNKLMTLAGLNEMGGIAHESGLDGKQSCCRTIVGLMGKPTGLLSLFTSAPLQAAELDIIPGDADMVMAGRLDVKKAYNFFLDFMATFNPQELDHFKTRGLPQLQQQLGLDLERDLLDNLGDCWRIWNAPGQGGLVFTGLTLAVAIKNKEKFALTMAKLHGLMAGQLNRKRYRSSGRQRRGIYLDSCEFMGRQINFLNFVGEESPVAPAWCLDGDTLLISLFPQTLKAQFQRGPKDLPVFSQRPEIAGMGKATSLVLLDMASLVRLSWPFLNSGAQLAFAELQRDGLDLNISHLPSPKAIIPYLGNFTSTVKYTNNSILQETRGVIPLVGNLFSGNIFFLGLLPPLSIFMEQAPGIRKPATRDIDR